MYMNASSKDLRYRTKAILKAVAAGKEVVITNRGQHKAVIRSIQSRGDQPAKADDGDSVVGMWADRQDIKNVASNLRRLRQGRFGA